MGGWTGIGKDRIDWKGNVSADEPNILRDLANKKYVDDNIFSGDHLLLTNIGTNSHAQIDTHLALTNEHIDWTNATQDFKTTGTGEIDGMVISNDDVKTTFLGKSGDYNRIGDATTTSHGTLIISEDDLLVTNQLEVDGIAYFDNTIRVGVASESTILLDLRRGNIVFSGITQKNDDGTHFWVRSDTGTNRNFIFTDYTWRNVDHDHDTLSANPTLFIHSATNPNSDNTQWISLTHDQTDGVIAVGKGGIKIPNDLIFTGAGTGLPYGEIYVNDNTTVTSVSNAGFTQFLHFNTNGHANLTTPEHAQDHIKIDKTGVYMVDCCVNIKNDSGAAHDIEVVIAKANGTSIFPNLRRHRTLGTGTDIGAIPLCGHLSLAVNDTIEVWITSDSASARDVIAEDVTLMVTMVGG